MTDVRGTTNNQEVQSRNMINTCSKSGFDSFIISGSYGGHRRHKTDDGRRTTPGVRHKLPTGELIKPLGLWVKIHSWLDFKPKERSNSHIKI